MQTAKQQTIHSKIIHLCEYINRHSKLQSTSAYIKKCETLELPANSSFSKQRCIYNVALAVTNIIMEKPEWLSLGTLLLKDFFQSQKYWDILHFLAQYRHQFSEIVKKSDEAFERVLIPGVSASFNINIKYQCHCGGKQFHLANSGGMDRIERCKNCLQLYHPLCQPSLLLCNKCCLKQCSLKYRTITTYFTTYLFSHSYLTTISFELAGVLEAKNENSSSFQVEIRMRACEAEAKNCGFENLEFYLNEQELNLKMKKKSNCIGFKLPLKLLEYKNMLIVKNLQPSKLKNTENRVMMLGIYKVVTKAFFKRKQNLSIFKMPEESLTFYYKYVAIYNRYPKSYAVPLSSCKNGKLITVPVRAFRCQHIQCFDYLDLELCSKAGRTSTSVNRVSRGSKHFLCPICGQDIDGIYVDTIFSAYLRENKMSSVELSTLLKMIEEQQHGSKMIFSKPFLSGIETGKVPVLVNRSKSGKVIINIEEESEKQPAFIAIESSSEESLNEQKEKTTKII